MNYSADVVSILQDLIRLPSVNPMGRDVLGEPYFEHRVTDYLQRSFERLGIPWHRQSIAPWRDNIVACVEGDAVRGNAIPILVWEVHQDTVPVDGMTIDPWVPALREGRVYGRGSCDVKGGMACMLAALARLVRERPAGRPTIILACTVNEENGFTGARQLSELWGAGDCPLLSRLPRGVIVAEPTGLNVVVAHKGVVRWSCHVRGRSAHSSQPQEGDNAIYRAGHVITALEQYAAALMSHSADRQLGVPTINVGTIHGGICVNAVPDLCSLEIDRRLLPEEDPHGAREDVAQWLTERLPSHITDHVDHDAPFLINHGLRDQSATELARRLQRLARNMGSAAELVAVPYGTDAPFFAQLGIPTVVFGPGSIAQAHTADEWVAIDQLERATEIYYRSATGSIV